MNARVKINQSPPLINVAGSVATVADQCERVLLEAGFWFEHCCGSLVVHGPGENVRPVTRELLAELLKQHAAFGTVNRGWQVRAVPPVAVSELMSRVIAQCMRQA